MKSLIVPIVTLGFMFGIMVVYVGCSTFGAKPKGDRLVKIKASSNYKDGGFKNLEETRMISEDASMLGNAWEFFTGGEDKVPDPSLKTYKFDSDKFLQVNKGIQAVWFGHSTVLIQVDGKTILTDPVFSKRASPLPFLAGKPFPYSETYQVDDLPPIDIVVISHDHYDHLDMDTIKKIKDKVALFVVPLGVTSHLEYWGVDTAKIVELNWGDKYSPEENMVFASTPARHYSGRSLFDRNTTLWSSWVIQVNKHKIYFGGDSGYGSHFKEIGDEYGPFELVMLECGQYNEDWEDIHMLPEKVVLAYQDLRASILLPVHWGKYELSLHSWREPMERLFAAAKDLDVKIITPYVGQTVLVDRNLKTAFWWKKKGEESPALALTKESP